MAGALAPLVFFGLALGSLVLASLGLRLARADARLSARLVGGRALGAAASPLPSAGRALLGRRLPGFLTLRGRDREDVEQRLRAAGFFERGALEAFGWVRIGACVLAACASMGICAALTGNRFSPLFPTFAAAGLAWIGVKVALSMRIAERERVLTAEFPFLIDLMLMMLESGVSLDQCIRSIAQGETTAAPNHCKLMALLVEDLDRGLDYQQAFDRWAARVGVSGAKELASLFRQSLFQGMELVPSLRAFSREFSERRVARAREAIGRITVRMVILMLVFFMPALFIVLAGPPVAAILDTLAEGTT